MTSHAYVLYMVAVKPFKTSSINAYVLANETFYSALIIATFIFVVNLSAALFLAVTDRAFSNVVTVVLLLVGAAALLVRDLTIVGLHRSLAHAAFNHIVIGLLRLALILLV